MVVLGTLHLVASALSSLYIPCIAYSPREFPSCIPLIVYPPCYLSPCCLFPSLSIPLIGYSPHCLFHSLHIPFIVYSTHCVFPSLCIPLIVYFPHCVFPSLCIPLIVYSLCTLWLILVSASIICGFLFVFWCANVRICYF